MRRRKFRRILEGLCRAGILPPRFEYTHAPVVMWHRETGERCAFYAALIRPVPLEGEEWKAA